LHRSDSTYNIFLYHLRSCSQSSVPIISTKASNDPLPGQHNDPPLPIQVNGQDEWEVDEILASKIIRGSLYYQASWKGYDPNPTWYSAWSFVGCPQKLKEFHEKYPEHPGPPKYLDEWIDCWHSDDKQPIEHRDKNAPKA
jgi:hypothetical protein